jgi:hypothetical protein
MRNLLSILAIVLFHFGSSSSSSVAAEPDAAELLRHARSARAVWQHFPGFTADATVRVDSQTEHGTIAVDQHGYVTAKFNNATLRNWAEEQVGSVADHRLPSTPEDEKPAFADDQTDHPLGRLIRLGDKEMESAYRIRDDVITEVNRRDGPERFTISVTDIERNKEGKYLPRSFSVTVWDADNGQIKSSSIYLNLWKRVGTFDLPQRVVEVESTPGGQRHAQEITLDNFRLTEKAK